MKTDPESQTTESKPNRPAGEDWAQSLVRLDLTPEQAKSLSEAIWDYCDCGPPEEGWASDEINALRSLIDAAIEKFESNTTAQERHAIPDEPCPQKISPSEC